MQTNLDPVALIGAITGVFSLIWLIYQHFNDKGRLEIGATVIGYGNAEAKPAGIDQPGEIWCRLTNIGRRNIYPTSIDFHFEKGGSYGVSASYQNFPLILEPGAYGSVKLPLPPSNQKVVGLIARDSLGRTYSLPAETASKINSQIEILYKEEKRNVS